VSYSLIISIYDKEWDTLNSFHIIIYSPLEFSLSWNVRILIHIIYPGSAQHSANIFSRKDTFNLAQRRYFWASAIFHSNKPTIMMSAFASMPTSFWSKIPKKRATNKNSNVITYPFTESSWMDINNLLGLTIELILMDEDTHHLSEVITPFHRSLSTNSYEQISHQQLEHWLSCRLQWSSSSVAGDG
jgi:hypothetical protein